MPRRHPIQDTRDAVCLAAYLDGWTTAELAKIIGVSYRTICRWLKRAKETSDPPNLELWMSGAGKQCLHGKPIVRGMPVLCLDCLETGLPNHPVFRQGDPVGGLTTSEHQPQGTPKSKLASPSAQPNLPRRKRTK